MLDTKKYINNNGRSKLKALRKTLKGGAQFQAGTEVKATTAVQGKSRPLPRPRFGSSPGTSLSKSTLQNPRFQGVVGSEDNSSSNSELSQTSQTQSERRRQRVVRGRQTSQSAPQTFNDSNSSNSELNVENLLPDPKTLPRDTKLKNLKVAMTEFAKITGALSKQIEVLNRNIT